MWLQLNGSRIIFGIEMDLKSLNDHWNKVDIVE